MAFEIKENIPLAPYTVYKIGGPARFFAEIKSSEDLEQALAWSIEHKTPFFVLGAGSNVLISNKGFEGLIIRMAGGEIRAEGEHILADAGVMMARVVLESGKAGLSGFEWGIGIPGTIGGSVRGNAGCFGGEMKDIVQRVEIFDVEKSSQRTMLAQDCEFAYRHSIFKKHPEWIILSATLALRKGDSEEIQKKIREITAERTQKQDIGTKSCGCIFKNVSLARKDIDRENLLSRFPELSRFREKQNIPASYLIDAAGLKGRKIGGVFISPKHANYFVNEGGATAEEVIMLISVAKDVVRRKFGILLDEEIQYVGF